MRRGRETSSSRVENGKKREKQGEMTDSKGAEREPSGRGGEEGSLATGKRSKRRKRRKREGSERGRKAR